MKTCYEVNANNYQVDEEFKRTFIFLKKDKVQFLMHLWYTDEHMHELLGFQISDAGESGNLINWNREGEFTLNRFSQGPRLSYWANPSAWSAADRNIIDFYLDRIEGESMDIHVKDTVASILGSFKEQKQEC